MTYRCFLESSYSFANSAQPSSPRLSTAVHSTHTSAERPLLNAALPQFFISQSTAIYLLKHTNRSSSLPGELWLMLYFTVWMCVYEEEYFVHVSIRLLVLLQSFISLCCLCFCLSVFCVLHRVRSHSENEKAPTDFCKSHCASVLVFTVWYRAAW